MVYDVCLVFFYKVLIRCVMCMLLCCSFLIAFSKFGLLSVVVVFALWCCVDFMMFLLTRSPFFLVGAFPLRLFVSLPLSLLFLLFLGPSSTPLLLLINLRLRVTALYYILAVDFFALHDAIAFRYDSLYCIVLSSCYVLRIESGG